MILNFSLTKMAMKSRCMGKFVRLLQYFFPTSIFNLALLNKYGPYTEGTRDSAFQSKTELRRFTEAQVPIDFFIHTISILFNSTEIFFEMLFWQRQYTRLGFMWKSFGIWTGQVYVFNIKYCFSPDFHTQRQLYKE